MISNPKTPHKVNLNKTAKKDAIHLIKDVVMDQTLLKSHQKHACFQGKRN